MRYVMICASPDCEFSKTNNYELGVDQFCPACGHDFLWKCPHCGRPLRDKGALFCSGCGKPLKDKKCEDGHGDSATG
ncbi:MAG: zinc-ribbon domain-containing protein [Desulfobacteraceae bacterium]|nr:zinc-ribbon domain-containing protein [Desulfobacteraceae bacterium]